MPSSPPARVIVLVVLALLPYLAAGVDGESSPAGEQGAGNYLAADAEQLARVRSAVAMLRARRGDLLLPGTGVTLALPAHFRFLPRAQLHRLAELRGMALADDALGWIAHEGVDLAARSIWFVEVRHVRAAGATRAYTEISAAVPARGGTVRYIYRDDDVADDPAELATRVTRLLAARTAATRD